MYYRPSLISEKMDSRRSFEFHTWMIARFIETSGSDKSFLSHYVIAVCYGRMITRMKYRVSKSFRDALKNLPPTFKFPGQIPLINTSTSNDRNFISFLLKVKVHLGLHTPIDNLVKHKDDLYNQETYVDFHSILCELLELLLKSLEELKDIHHNTKKTPSLEQLCNTTKAKIDFIATVGTLLRLLVKSRAVKRCLYSISGFLPDRAAGIKAKDDNKTDDDDDDGDERDRDDKEDELCSDEDEDEDGLYRDDNGDELERDDESDAVEQGSASIELDPKSQACLRSLNLGVVYFDAILVLSHFVKRQESEQNFPGGVNISIKVLVMPDSSKDSAMLSWKTLLQHETYFPGKPSPSAKEIVAFLESRASSIGNQRLSQNTTDNQKLSKKGQKSKKIPVLTGVSPESVLATLAVLRHDINDLNKDTFDTKIDEAVSSMMTLQYDDTSSGSTKYIRSIIQKLALAKTTHLNKVDAKDVIDDIMDMLRTLADNTRLERTLREGSPLDTGIGFKGSLHAEACVAAYCTFTEPEWFSHVSYFIIMFCSDILILLVVCCYTSSRCI